MTAGRPLDLRLLPAALAAWAAALAAVHTPWDQALGLGAGLVLAGVLLALVLGLLHRLIGMAAPVQVLLCCAVAGTVMLLVGQQGQHFDASGWEQAVKEDAPVTVTVRISGQPQRLDSPGFSGEQRVLAHAVAEQASWPDQREPLPVDAPVVILAESTGEQMPFEAGRRYRGMVRTAATDAGARETAFLYPFDADLQELPADRRTEVAEHFNGLRLGTVQASSHAVGDAPALLPGLILGDRSGQGPELTEAMQAAGLSHLTAVSGANCALVMGTLMGAVRLFRLPRWSAVPVSLAGLVFFVLLVHPEPSVIRAGVMGSVAAVSLFAGRGRSSFALLCLCVLVLLLWDPWYAMAPAFQLSAAATAGIVLIGTGLREKLERGLPAVLAAPLALAFSAQLFVTPVLLPLSSAVNTYAVPANLLAAGFVPFVTVPGTFAAVISAAVPWAAVAVLWGCGLAAACIGQIGRAAAALPQASAPWPEGWVGWALLCLYVGAALALAWGLIDRLRRWHAGVIACAAGAMAALIVPAQMLGSGGPPAQWRAALCDVGQGDMIVVRTGQAAGIVVDAGEDPGLADSCLRDLGIDEVSALLLTHEHRDHYGGAAGVIQGREPALVLYSASAGWNLRDEVQAVAALPEHVPVHRAQAGQTLEYSDRYPVRVHVWAAESHHAEANDNSLVVIFDMTDPQLPATAIGSANAPMRLLAAGDLEEEAASLLLQREGVPEQVHLLKVAHHGAANGGTEILQELRPEVALISVGEENDYGHPSQRIVGTLEEAGAAVYRTDQHGTVVITVDSDGIGAAAVP